MIQRVTRRSPSSVVKLLVTYPVLSLSIWRTANYSQYIVSEGDAFMHAG